MTIKALYPESSSSLMLDAKRLKRLPSTYTFTRSSTATYIDKLGVLQTAAINQPRFDHSPTTIGKRLGLLIEESRTNSIRNNTMVGAVAGTPGTLPTNWLVQGGGVGTLTQEIVGVGTQNGINYIDIRYSGTTSTTETRIAFEPNTQITASTGQSWTASAYTAMVAGSLSNITAVQHTVVERNAAGSILGQSVQDVSTTNTLVRGSVSRTFADATAARVNSQIAISFPFGVAIDITLRIGLPQLELGSFVTSVIPTTGSTATRSADVCTVTETKFSSRYNTDGGTVLSHTSGVPGNTPNMYSIDDGTANERIFGQYASTVNISSKVVDGGIDQYLATIGNAISSAGLEVKHAHVFNADDFATAVNGTLGSTDVSGTLPVVNRIIIGTNVSATSALNAYISRFLYWPQRLSNINIQNLTKT